MVGVMQQVRYRDHAAVFARWVMVCALLGLGSAAQAGGFDLIGYGRADGGEPIRFVALRQSPNGALVVRNDRGGRVGARADQIAALRQRAQRVEIRGTVCLSTCTMFLALPQTCVEAATTFGFHGPSYYGRALSARDFEHWSQVIAAHYPEVLRAWYLETGRYRMSGYYKIKGAALIKMGVARCR